MSTKPFLGLSRCLRTRTLIQRNINMWNLSENYKLHLNLNISVDFYPRNLFDDLFPNTWDKRIHNEWYKISFYWILFKSTVWTKRGGYHIFHWYPDILIYSFHKLQQVSYNFHSWLELWCSYLENMQNT